MKKNITPAVVRAVFYPDKIPARELRNTINDAGDNTEKMRIKYHKKTTGEIVNRTISPYSERGDKLFATCNTHGGQIHSFIRERIIDATPLATKFRPKWEVELGEQYKRKKMMQDIMNNMLAKKSKQG